MGLLCICEIFANLRIALFQALGEARVLSWYNNRSAGLLRLSPSIHCLNNNEEGAGPRKMLNSSFSLLPFLTIQHDKLRP